LDWSKILSIGEQQRLSFIRLLALFTYSTASHNSRYLVLLDESTSAIDTQTEMKIYETMVKLQIWFITISHRQSLIKYHQKQLNLSLPGCVQSDEIVITNGSIMETETINEEEQQESYNSQEQRRYEPWLHSPIESTDTKRMSFLKSLENIWIISRLPFDINDRRLRLQTYLAWLCSVLLLGLYVYVNYRLVSQTGTIFRVLSDYAASNISITIAKQRLKSEGVILMLHIISLTLLSSAHIGGGQLIASLSTQRQMSYIGKLLLTYDTMYHSQNKLLPSIISHDLANFNENLFYFLFGSIYFNGFFSKLYFF